jgi:hypothetical protein
VRFQSGSVDPGAQVRFRFFITNPTPVPEFYLLQEPRAVKWWGEIGILSSYFRFRIPFVTAFPAEGARRPCR